MDNYSPLDPLGAARIVHSGDSRPHSNLLDAFSGDPSREESPTPKEVSSFGSNCPAVFIIPMGMPVRETKQDVVSSTLTSGVESMTRRSEEDEVPGNEDTANRVPMTFYSHRDSAIGGGPDVDLVVPDPNSMSSRGTAVEEHYQLAHNREDEEEREVGQAASSVPVRSAEDDTDHDGDSHVHQEG